MANEITENRNLSRLQTSPVSDLAQRSSTSEVAKLVARCLANYGERRGADMRLLAAEWQTSLGAYPADRLNAALSEHIRRSSFWPTVADFVEILREQTPAPGLPMLPREEREFCREGRTQVEEMTHRAAQVLRWKQEYGFGQSKDPLESPRVIREASQDLSVSEALLATAAVQRMQEREGVS